MTRTQIAPRGYSGFKHQRVSATTNDTWNANYLTSRHNMAVLTTNCRQLGEHRIKISEKLIAV